MLTQEDKQLIAEYMGWTLNETSGQYEGYDGRYYSMKDFDLNDAGLCVQEMQKRGEWLSFLKYVNTSPLLSKPANWYSFWPDDFISYLFNAENFFAAMAAYLKEGKK